MIAIIVKEKRPIRASFRPQAMRTFHIIKIGIDRTCTESVGPSSLDTWILTHGIGNNICGSMVVKGVSRKALLVRCSTLSSTVLLFDSPWAL